MRGKPGRVCYKSENRRITPADAGKTPKTLDRAAKRGDHPRGCGENMSNGVIEFEDDGSPPRMRGKLHCGIGYDIRFRITPADAGKTRSPPLSVPQ